MDTSECNISKLDSYHFSYEDGRINGTLKHGEKIGQCEITVRNASYEDNGVWQCHFTVRYQNTSILLETTPDLDVIIPSKFCILYNW